MDAGALAELDPAEVFVTAFGAFQGQFDGARQVSLEYPDGECFEPSLLG